MTGPAPSELGDDPYAVTNIAFSADTRVLAVTGSTGQVEHSDSESQQSSCWGKLPQKFGGSLMNLGVVQ